MNIAAALKKTFLFKDFPPDELEKLAGVCKHEKLVHDSTLFREGEKGAQFFLILMGSVRVLKKNRDGVDQEVATLSTGSYFGEMAVVDDDHDRSATIITQEQTELLTLSQPDVQKLFAKDDKLAHHFYRAMCRGLTRRLRATTQDAAFFKALAQQRH
ncbi:MAG: cyclic nucleotide-binding domain-containing protein [Deltaproteobacteria bacterium]|nr:cyclic nucleotide-binding domain-containing protein [Deltaproteobacteria bacterium]